MSPYAHSLSGAVTTAALSLPPSVLTRMFGGPHVVDGAPLQPATQALLSIGARLGLIDDNNHDVADWRRRTRRSSDMAMPKARSVDVSDGTLPGAESDLSVRWYRPWQAGSQRQPTILYLHGGGWVVGDLETHDGLCRALAVASSCNVVSLDYRLAPESPYPAALDDSVAAFRQLRDTPTADGIPGGIAVMGDSAGGNLAAVLCQRMRDLGEPGPVAQGLLYPATDLRMTSPSIDLFADGYFLTKADMQWYRGLYAPSMEQWSDPGVSPLLADDLSGLPPAWVWTAGFDPLRDEGDDYAARLQDAGVEVRHRCYADQIHAFASMGILPGGMARTLDIGRQMGALTRSAIASA